MRPRWSGLYILCLTLLNAGPGSPASAQTPNQAPPIQLIPRTKQQRDRAYKSEHRVTLSVHVTDTDDNPITGLTAGDFELLDNQTPRKISEFRELDADSLAANARVVVVLDGINDGGSAIGPVRKDLDKFLAQSSKPLPLPLSFAFVSDVPKLLVQDSMPVMSANSGVIETQPTTDRAQVKSSLAELSRHSHQIDCLEADGSARSYCLAEHFTASLKALMKILKSRRNSPGPTFVLWTGRGWPLVAERKGYYRAWLVELNTDLRQAHVILDVISSNGFQQSKKLPTPLPGPGTSDEDAERDLTLQALAEASGGEAYGKVKNFANAIWRAAEKSGGLYSLSFDSSPSETVDAYHSIELKVDRPNATVRTLSSYYAQP